MELFKQSMHLGQQLPLSVQVGFLMQPERSDVQGP